MVTKEARKTRRPSWNTRTKVVVFQNGKTA